MVKGFYLFLPVLFTCDVCNGVSTLIEVAVVKPEASHKSASEIRIYSTNKNMNDFQNVQPRAAYYITLALSNGYISKTFPRQFPVLTRYCQVSKYLLG